MAYRTSCELEELLCSAKAVCLLCPRQLLEGFIGYSSMAEDKQPFTQPTALDKRPQNQICIS